MKKLTTKQIQDVSLRIMKEVHAFCLENNIRYSLAYGTLIGAIRHKDFIPWDDDLDIIMPRPDYERFCKTYKGATTKAFATCLGNCYLNYGRVCDMVDTSVIPHTTWTSEETGVWIDVFPVDGISDSYENFKNKGNALRALDNKLFEARGAKDVWCSERSLLFNLKKVAKHILFGHYDIDTIKSQYQELLKPADFETSKNAGAVQFPITVEKEFLPTEIYREYMLTDFCDTKFYILKEYDKFLTHFYGNYMQLPPVEKRVPDHSCNIYSWKSETNMNNVNVGMHSYMADNEQITPPHNAGGK
jgi:lipopolysaccharide cholinephosphotransferase